MINLDLTYIEPTVSALELAAMSAKATSAYKRLQSKDCPGSDFLGWMDLPETIQSLVADIKHTAAEIRRRDAVHVVVGIGGSYLGARCVIEALRPPTDAKPEILYAGHNLSASYAEHLLSVLEKRDFSVNVISKSGTTTEPAVLFRMIRNVLEKKYGEAEGLKRVIATTDEHKGTLRDLATKFGLKSYPIPDDVGGRYSVFTAVGLLPIAVAGIDIEQLLAGARDLRAKCVKTPFETNPVLQYAAARHLLYQKGKQIEVFANFQPQLHYLSEWLKQLFGESEGKEGKSVFPAACDYTTDLHSMGQYVQEGLRTLFETFIAVEKTSESITVPTDPQNADGLNFLAGKPLEEVNRMAYEGTRIAHADGGVPNFTWRMPELNAYHLGGLLYAFEVACAVSGLLNGINPFNQPGVEAYKKNMFALLGKPGFETEASQLTQRTTASGRRVSCFS